MKLRTINGPDTLPRLMREITDFLTKSVASERRLIVRERAITRNVMENSPAHIQRAPCVHLRFLM